MPKMSNFRKSLRLHAKADKHYFRNWDSKTKYEAHTGWVVEGYAINTKRKLRKGAGPMLKAC